MLLTKLLPATLLLLGCAAEPVAEVGSAAECTKLYNSCVEVCRGLGEPRARAVCYGACMATYAACLATG